MAITSIVVLFAVSACVAQEYTLPTSISLPTVTVTPIVIAAVPTVTMTPIDMAALPTVETPNVVILDAPTVFSTATPITLSRALTNGAPFPSVFVKVPLPGIVAPMVAVVVTLAPTIESASIVPVVITTAPPSTAIEAAPTLIAAAPTAIVSSQMAGSVGAIAAPVESVGANLDGSRSLLRDLPTFAQFDTPQVRVIAERGRALGVRGQVFTTVGDSNSVSGDFMRPLVLENYCEWGTYSPLQEAVRYFSVPTDGISRSSFTHESIAVQMGFNSAAARDPFWATDPRCEGGETPVVCELRVVQPAIIIFMLGGKDVSRMSLATYQANMAALVDDASARGTIPVLTTFVVLPGRDVYDESLAFNLALVDIARSRGIPLINLWAAAENLPGNGIAADGTHLRTQPGRFCDFDGGEQRYGGTLRNLLTLNALDLLRRGVLAR
ncbi:MAG: hypothetical protein SGJ24_02445 [Chloroflexota bacterium]|nr:hypothetical protein [Chloroflexota bacterium]